MERLRKYSCPKCKEGVTDRCAIDTALTKKRTSLLCNYCDHADAGVIDLRDVLEKQFTSKEGEAQADLAAALPAFTESKSIFERLAASDPANAAWQRDLFYSMAMIATRVFQPQERWAEALELMEKGLAINERLAAIDPTNVMWQNDVRVSRRVVAGLRAQVAGK